MPALTVEQNVFLGVEPRQAGFQQRRELRRRYRELAASASFELDGAANAGCLQDSRPAEGRDPPRAEPQRPAHRDGRADRRAVAARTWKALPRGDPPLASSGTTVVLVSNSLARCSSSPTR